ncbi:ferredoxin [Candidatus Woesearchaeota archaeon]|nr:ferredoxin [Candidatus Woesearchaeota archaeon]
MAKIMVDQEKCIGCGACASTCPDLFVIEEGKAKALKEEVEDTGCAKDAEDVCPVDAIKVAD